jgi:hypothetical protein
MKRLITISILASLLVTALASSATARRKYYPSASPDSNIETVARLRL